jgi:hypothetical protein
MAAVLYPLGTVLPPGLAVAVGIPLGALVYVALLRGVMPRDYRILTRPLAGAR